VPDGLAETSELIAADHAAEGVIAERTSCIRRAVQSMPITAKQMKFIISMFRTLLLRTMPP